MFLSTAVEHKAPYKMVLTHGFTVDEKGEKMSKSKGNVVAPDAVLKEYGSEILRLWVASSDYQGDLKISQNILKQSAENYRKLRNTFRIMLANINDLKAITPYNEMGELDKWILSEAKTVLDAVYKSFSNYNFVHGMSMLNNFIVNELSGIYIDITKDSLYCDAINDPRRTSSQSAMAIMTKSLLTLIAPILTYTADEIVEHLPAVIKGEREDIFDFVHEGIEGVASTFDAPYMNSAREKFFEIVDGLKKEKIIKNTLELVIVTESEKIAKMDKTAAEDWFVVSGISHSEIIEELGKFEVDGDIFVIQKATKAKCPRCWKYQSIDEEHTCERCSKVLNA
jgi:isoleucyl-tRNA synthetase